MARGRALAHPVPARQTDLAIQLHGMNLPTLPVTGKGSQTGRVLLRRSGTVPPLPWSTFAPPLTLTEEEQIAYRLECRRICQAIAQRDRDLVEPENLRAFQIAQRHGTTVEHPRLKGRTSAPVATATSPGADAYMNFVPPKAKGSGARAPLARESGQSRA